MPLCVRVRGGSAALAALGLCILARSPTVSRRRVIRSVDVQFDSVGDRDDWLAALKWLKTWAAAKAAGGFWFVRLSCQCVCCCCGSENGSRV